MAYIDLRTTQRLLKLTRDDITALRERTSMMESRSKHGLANDLDLERQRLQLADLEEHLAAGSRVGGAPRALLELGDGGVQRPVDIDAARLGHGGQRCAGRRLVSGERGALRCGHLLAGDHEVVGAGEGLVKGG